MPSSSGVAAKAHSGMIGQGEQAGDDDRALAADPLRPDAEADAADDRADVHDRGEDAGQVRVEVMLLLEEGRIEVLRAVAEEVERRHQHDEVERDLPVADELARSG